MFCNVLIFGVLTLLAGNSFGADKEKVLMVGDPAPKLQVGKWVQGEPVTGFQSDKAYIVEFWATWCGPCRTSIPHLNEVHNKFKDKGLVVIGQDVWENNEKLVEPFVKEMGNKMTYRVVLDDKSDGGRGKMAETWMTAAGQNGIPSAFVVDKQGKIAWIGHPMSLQEELLTKVLDGSFDLTKAAAEYAAKKTKELTQAPIRQKFRAAMNAKEFDKADAALLELEQVVGPDEREDLIYDRYNLALAKKDLPAAYIVVRQALAAPKIHPMMLNELAWSIATAKNIEHRDLDLALKVAQRANKETKEENPEILDTLARVHALKGDMKTAVTFQEKAVAKATGGRKTQFDKVLAAYKEGKIP